MHELAPLIYDLAIMLGVAALVVLIFQRIHQPVVLGYLVAGLIIGPHTPPYSFISDKPNIEILSELGVIFLMFSLGLEFSFKKLTRVGFSASITGTLEVIFMLSIGYGVGMLMGWKQFDSLFLGAALAISSTTIIIKAIDELKLKTSRFAELVFGVLIVEDLLAIILLVGLSTFVSTNNVLSFDMLSAVIKLILVVGSWFIVGYFLVPTVFRSINNYLSPETLTITSIALCLFLVTLAAKFHYSTALGAFIMGSILAETNVVESIHEGIKPIRDIFAAVFFISVGMLIDPQIIFGEWKAVLLLAVVTLVGKAIITAIGAFSTGQSMRTSIRAGFSMAQIGEFSFIIVALGVALNAVGSKIYPLVVAVSAITTFTTPYMIRFSVSVSEGLEKHMPDRLRWSLKQYTAWVHRAQADAKGNPKARVVAMRLVINGILVAIIFTVADLIVFPKIPYLSAETWEANTISLFIAMIFSLPFIWGMLFSYRVLANPNKRPAYLRPSVLIIWAITLLELALLGVVEFNSWLTLSIFAGVAFLFFIFLYRQLEHSYAWFEQQLVGNIGQGESDEAGDDTALWDMHFVKLSVHEDSDFVCNPLSDMIKAGIKNLSILAIVRAKLLMSRPSHSEIIQPGDKLIVFGNDKNIEQLKEKLGSTPKHALVVNYLDRFRIKAIHVHANTRGVDGTVSEFARLHGDVNIVGLEREGKRIQFPSGQRKIIEDDLILVVEEIDQMR